MTPDLFDHLGQEKRSLRGCQVFGASLWVANPEENYSLDARSSGTWGGGGGARHTACRFSGWSQFSKADLLTFWFPQFGPYLVMAPRG